MTLLTPFFGVITALIVVPLLLLLYMLKLRRERRDISSTLLWTSRTQDLRANSLLQRLRLSPLFLLQFLLLLMLAAALMGPILKEWSRPSGRVVFFIDQSASMQTRDAPDARTRLEEAKRLAIAQVELWQGGGLFAASPPEVMVIAFAQEPSVRIPYSTNLARIREAINAIEATDQLTLLAPAMSLARAFSEAQSSPQEAEASPQMNQANNFAPTMQLLSDGNISDIAELVLRNGEVISWTRCGDPNTINQGISAAGAERRNDDPSLVGAFMTLRNDAQTVAKREVQVRNNGTLIASASEPITIPPATGKGDTRVSGAQKLSFAPFTLENSGVLSMNLLPEDAFATDDHAVIAIQEQQTLRILLAGNDPALESLLNSLSFATVQQISSSDFIKRISSDATWTESFDVVVCVDCELQSLTAGRWLIFGKPPAISNLNAYGQQTRQAIRAWKSDHKTMAQSQFSDLVVDRSAAIAPTSDWLALLEGSKGPLIVSGRDNNATVIYVAFLPLDSNWPFQRSFVNFTAQAVEFLGALGSAVTSESLEPGAMLRTRIARGSSNVSIQTPSGDRIAQTPTDGEIVFGPIRNVGVYKVESVDPLGKKKTRMVAVNLTNLAECNVAAANQLNIPAGDLQSTVIGLTALSIWPLLVSAALCLLIVEWFLYHRYGGSS